MSDIKLSKDTLATLNKVFNVNQTLKLVEGEKVLKVLDPNGDILIHAPIAENIPRDFHVYDVRELNSVLSIINEPTLDFSNDDHLVIRSEDGKQVVHYAESEPEYVTSYVDRTPTIGDSEVAVTVTKEQFDTVIKARNAMKLDYIGFVSDGDTISLIAFDRNDDSSDEFSNKYSIELCDDDGGEPFEMFYAFADSDLGILSGEGDLNFFLGDKKISRIETELERTYWITMHIKSWYGEQ